MKIALQVMGDEKWFAGEVLVRNLLYLVPKLGYPNIRLSLILSKALANNRADALATGAECLQYSNLTRRSPRGVRNEAYKRLFLRDWFLEQFLKQNGVNVLFGPVILFKCANVATLSWLPDFQHVHLPQMFSVEQRAERDQTFMQSAKSATRIILLSESVRRDFEAFAPHYATKARVLSPISRIPDSAYETDPREIVSLYHLPERFVYMPNQFWKHKNHELVFRAIKKLKDEGLKVSVVCSGYPGDARHAGYFAGLWEKVSQWNIRDQIIYIGVIPHDHVLLLVRQSVCVVNASRFEGWGISVDEARSVGKRVLVSEIAAHREQDPPMATYFHPEDCGDLERKLADIWNYTTPGPDVDLEREARLRLSERLRSYAETFVAVAKEAYQEVGV